MTTAYLSLGSNLGDRAAHLAQALKRLGQEAHTSVIKVSSVYETIPQGKTDQPLFLNIAVEVETTLSPEGLLAHTQAVENSLGRVRKERWGPRTLDIDILLQGDQLRFDPALELPHPRMAERAFVLIPVLELNSRLVSPDSGIPLQTLLSKLPDQGVKLFLTASSFLERLGGVE